GQLTGGLDLDAVGKGGGGVQGLVAVIPHRQIHAGGPRRLDAVDLDVGPQALDGEGDARDQPAAPDGDDHRIQVGQLVQDLQADGPLPGNDQLVVVRVDEGHARLGLEADRVVVGVVVGAGHQADLRAQVLGVFHLHDGGAVRHADDAPDAHPGGGQGHAL